MRLTFVLSTLALLSGCATSGVQIQDAAARAPSAVSLMTCYATSSDWAVLAATVQDANGNGYPIVFVGQGLVAMTATTSREELIKNLLAMETYNPMTKTKLNLQIVGCKTEQVQ